MKRQLNKKKGNVTDLITDFENTWSQFEQSLPEKNSVEKNLLTNESPKKIKKIKKVNPKKHLNPTSPRDNQKNLGKKISSPQHFLKQGLNFYNKGDYKKAISCFQIVLDLDPYNIESKDFTSKAQAKLSEEQKDYTMKKDLKNNLSDLETLENITQEIIDGSNDKEVIKPLEKSINELTNISATYMVENEEQSDLGIEGLIDEITKRKNAEEKLKVLSSAVELSTEGIAVFNLNGDLLFVNNAYANMHGYNSENIIGKNMSTFQASEQLSIMETASKQTQESDEFRGEDWHIRSDGSVFPTYSNTSLFKDELGNPIGMIATHRDITKLKKSEEEIRKLSSAVEQSIDGIAIGDLDSKLTYVNVAFAEMHGYSTDEMIGMKVEQLHENAQMKVFKKGMDEVKTKGSWGGEIERLKKDGATFPSYMSITLLKNKYGNLTAFLAITRDITKRKQMEEELKRYNEHLADEVKKRTNDLIQSEKMASLGQIVAGVAHEINNPLGFVNSNTEIIKEYIQMLKNICKGKKAREIFKDINKLLHTNLKGMYRIAKTTKSLERFAIPYRGEKVPADINQGLKNTLLILSNQFKHRIKVTENYGNIPKIVCSIGQLNQAFTNIILNASEAMNKGNIWIKTSKVKNIILIEMTDDGIGIAEDLIHKIFDPFFSTKEGYKGLGLSLSYRIIQAHKGDIRIGSEVGVGTKVTISLPMVGEND